MSTDNNVSNPPPPTGVPPPTAPPEICRVSFKAPDFWKAYPQLWFDRLECQFRTSSITNDATKFDYTVASLNCEALSEAADIVRQPPAANRYETLKSRLISRFADSETKKTQQLLTGIGLGDSKPSQLLHKMQILNENRLPDDLLKTLWMEQLPQHIKAILIASKDDLSTLATLADKIFESIGHIPIATVHNYPSSSHGQPPDTNTPTLVSLQDQITHLTAQVKRMTRARSQSRPRPTQTEPSNQPEHCWYHRVFQDNAKKCKPPCQYQPENATGSR